MTQNVTVRLRADDDKILDRLFDTNDGIRSKTATIDDIDITLGEVKRRRGMATEDLIITIVVNVATGLPTSLLAAWMYDKLTEKGKTPIEVGDDPEVKTTEAEIEKALNVPAETNEESETDV